MGLIQLKNNKIVWSGKNSSAENNIRWIIDYKTGTHSGGALEAFLDREKERYQGQLEMYRRLMGAKEEREIQVGLYFPGLNEWRSW